MKKLILIAGLLSGWLASAFGQNYISGIVGLYGTNTASGSTTIASGASFYFNNNTFYEQGDFINLGDSMAMSADTGKLALSGTALQTLSGRFKIGALQLLNTAGATITNAVSPSMITILDSVSFGNISNTSFDAGDGLMTLRSNIIKTARVADLTNNNANTGNAITGRVIAERYLNSRRAWHLLGPPTTADSVNDQTIKDAWQEGVSASYNQVINPNPGYGTVVTRPSTHPPTATGYDDGIPNSSIYSLYSYSSNGYYSNPPNTDLTHFSPHAAYLLFIRGDRSVTPQLQTNTYHTPSTITTLRSKGALHNGDVTFTVTNAAGNYAGVSNPYACTVDFSKAVLNGVVNGFYVVDPSINTLGGFVYIDGDDNYNATPVPFGGSGVYSNAATNSLLQSGEAILVRPIGNTGTIAFKESNKNITSNANVFRQNPLPSLHVYLYSGDSSHFFMDGTTAVFDASFSKEALPDEDIYKPENLNENFSFYAGNNYLMKEKWSMPAAGDTLPLRLWKTSATKYRLTANTSNLSSTSQPYLIDKYLHTSTAIPASGLVNYDFVLTQDAASKAADRFAVVFGATVLPVTHIQLKGDLENDGVALQWNVLNENGILAYDIERSVDGGNAFVKIGNTATHGNNLLNDAYSFVDQQPLAGDNYYRIKMIELNGGYKYTNVVKVTEASEVLAVSVSPNPVANQVMRLIFSHTPSGKYLVTLYAGDGKQILSKTITHPGGTATYKTTVSSVAKGYYRVAIMDEKDSKKKINLAVAIE